ncbi:MAG: hypothetical protein QOF89_1733 [Acidobacteriota bacterium]|jgi:CHASE2 domain-containing sensor protein|nr:hypothetical protein [Acidobacteriota bacterium]
MAKTLGSSRIFISYRREDSAGYTRLLYEELVKRFGNESIFLDVTQIKPGEDFAEVIAGAVGSCQALIAVIGKTWLTVADGTKRRLDDPNDQLRLEIKTALDRNIKVFPVLVDGARMPKEFELPVDLAPLARRQAVEVRDSSWRYDFSMLITALEELAHGYSRRQAQRRSPRAADRKSTADLSVPLRRHWSRQILGKGPRYWLTVVFLIFIGVGIGNWLDRQRFGTDLRFQVFQGLQALSPHRGFSRMTAIVMINDEDYWKGPLSGRTPLKRDYLADLVRALDLADPAVIALDLDLRSPIPDGSLIERPEYQAETLSFLMAVKDVSSHRTIVLPKTLGIGPGGALMPESDIYDHFDFKNGDVKIGHVTLLSDVQRVPARITLKNGIFVNSFARAIVRDFQSESLEERNEAAPPYIAYLRASDFPVFSATDVLSNPTAATKLLAHKIVLVGGAWHSRAYNRGPQVDVYRTPVGLIPGVFIHANYVESLLNARTFQPIPESLLVTVEILLVLTVAVIFVLDIRPQYKLLSIGSVSLLLVVFSFTSWQLLNLLPNFWVPTLLLGGHLLVEQILEWRNLAVAKSTA